ncbi:MAG TPA: LysR family transcriptional regulator [Acidimicrobiales bacterium]|jgi:DNA-binding transcriptional LysR family regulator|nr:LysR family transcriptional regulator [Acidimicrobiales bacterium]
MDLRQLTVLVAVADHGSFSAAADALSTVQSNVSAHVARLERELGCALVDRRAGRLTEEGEAVVARARRVSGELEALTGDLSALRQEVVGTARLGLIATTARWLVPRLLRLAAERHPRLRLEAVEGNTTVLEPLLASGRLDLAVLNAATGVGDLVLTPLFDEDLVLVVAASDPLADAGPLEPAALAHLDLLLPLQGTAFRNELDAVLAPLGVTLQPRTELDGVGLLASLTFEGLGPAILPATAVPRYLRGDWRLVQVKGMPRRRIGVAVRRWGMPSAATRAVLALLDELVSEGPSLPEGLHPVRQPPRPQAGDRAPRR